MKVSINSKFIDGPYGGGMQVAQALRSYFESHNATVVNDLNDDDIDIIFHINPFPFLMRVAQYSFIDAYQYKLRHPKTVVVNGVHECDERKGSHYMNRLLVKASHYADHVVFVASWLRPLLAQKGLPKEKPTSVILNGADERVFTTSGKTYWDGTRKLRLITHHWGGHYLKGHDVYQQIEKKLADPAFAEKYSFTYVGNYPSGMTYEHTTVKAPLSGKELADEIRAHDVYVTASRNEPAGLHHIEGALCGLPIVYINSGGIPEYCDGYGIECTPETFFDALEKMREEYDSWVETLTTYDHTATKMASQYYELAKKLLADREHYQDARPAVIRTLLRWWLSFVDPVFGLYMKIKVRLTS